MQLLKIMFVCDLIMFITIMHLNDVNLCLDYIQRRFFEWIKYTQQSQQSPDLVQTPVCGYF